MYAVCLHKGRFQVERFTQVESVAFREKCQGGGMLGVCVCVRGAPSPWNDGNALLRCADITVLDDSPLVKHSLASVFAVPTGAAALTSDCGSSHGLCGM